MIFIRLKPFHFSMTNCTPSGTAVEQIISFIKLRPWFYCITSSTFFVRFRITFCEFSKPMKSVVFSMCHYLKIFNSVVGFYFIYVVNCLTFQKPSAKMLFHYKPMLSKCFSFYRFKKIPMRICSASFFSNFCFKRVTISIPPIIVHFAPSMAKSFFVTQRTFHNEVFIENT